MLRVGPRLVPRSAFATLRCISNVLSGAVFGALRRQSATIKGGEQPGLFLGNFDGRRLCQATTSARQKVSAVSQRRARGAQLPRRKAGVELFHLVPGRFGLPEDKPLRAQGFPDCGVMQCEAGRKQLRFRPLPYVELPVGLSEVEASRGSQRKSHVSPVSPRLDRSISSCESRGWRT